MEAQVGRSVFVAAELSVGAVGAGAGNSGVYVTCYIALEPKFLCALMHAWN